MSEAHWSGLYEQRVTEELPWHEPVTSTSEFVTANTTPHDSVIDIGGGASLLAAELLDLGYADVTVLDLSETALERARSHVESGVGNIDWIHTDVTTFMPSRTWDLWHDRAVFHFLVESEQRSSYRVVAANAVVPGGVLVVSTFALEGPEMCAGLPVRRYDTDLLAAEFSPEFEVIWVGPVIPGSAAGDQRPYVVVVMTRVVER